MKEWDDIISAFDLAILSNPNICDYDARQFLDAFISNLPKPDAPYDQAIMYRKLVGME